MILQVKIQNFGAGAKFHTPPYTVESLEGSNWLFVTHTDFEGKNHSKKLSTEQYS